MTNEEKIDSWRIATKSTFLTDLGPRIEALRGTGYNGSGFHYDKEQRFAKCIGWLAFPFVRGEESRWSTRRLIANMLIKDVEEAELSVIQHAVRDLAAEIDEMERQDANEEITFTHKDEIDARRKLWSDKCDRLKQLENDLTSKTLHVEAAEWCRDTDSFLAEG